MFGGSGISLADIAAVTKNNGENGDGWGGNNGWWILIILFALFGWGRGGYGGYDSNGGSNGGGNTVVVPVPGYGCGGGMGPGGYFTDASIQRGFDNQSVMNKLNGIENGICSLGYDQLAQMNGINNTVQQAAWGIQQGINAVNVANMQNTNALSTQLANCCCENRQGQADIKYAMATDTCAITTAINQAAQNIMQNDNANYRQLHDENVAIQMQGLKDRIAEQQSLIQSLNLAQSQANQNQYLISQLRPCPTPAYITCNPWASQAPYGSCCQYNNTGCCN